MSLRLIAIYLITASLPLGLSPTTQLLQACGLEGQYAPLIAAVKVGQPFQTMHNC